MKSLSKDDFISAIESLQLQVSKDIDNSNTISKVFDTDAVYDNSLLVKAVIKLLQVFFPKDENGFCEIEHYCFDMNFGKVSDQELITPEDLWDRLNDSLKDKKYYDLNHKTEIDLWLNRVESEDVDFYQTDLMKTYMPLILKKPFDKEPIPSTHPFIDDYPKQETILDIIEREKKDAHEMIKQNNLYGHCFANERFFQGRIHALEAIEKVLKSK